jgi:hypothetical protein
MAPLAPAESGPPGRDAVLRTIVPSLLLAAGVVLALFIWQGRCGFDLADEGFLWYGAQRVLKGEVPLRDFMSYDPGRYYWSAALMRIHGDDGIVTLRAAVAIFQSLGLAVALALLSGSLRKRNISLWLVSAATLAVWMFPRQKLFDISISIALVGALAFLLQNPSRRRYFATGLMTGSAAVFGRNHGLYGAAGSIGLMAALSPRNENGPGLFEAFALWTGGVVVGYLPVLLMLTFVPDFARAFWESIRFLFEVKTTNLPLPVPWPWRVSFSQDSFIESLRGVLAGFFFIAIVAFGVLGIAWSIRQRLKKSPIPRVLTASAFMALPYAHVAFSRADIGHLAQGIFPFLIGSFAFLEDRPARIKWPAATLLCGAGLLVMIPRHPGWQCRSGQPCVEAAVGDDALLVTPATAEALTLLEKLAARFSPGDRAFMAPTFWPGAYAALGRKSPVWEIYPLFPRSADFQQSEIEKMTAADPGFALVDDAAIDGRQGLRYSQTHALIYEHVQANFERMTDDVLNTGYALYVHHGRTSPQSP